jgi:hypothetical protein
MSKRAAPEKGAARFFLPDLKLQQTLAFLMILQSCCNSTVIGLV